MTETPLGGGATHAAVVRVGDTVRRPPSTATREALRRLEQAGFDAAPRFLGTDELGRDVLTWIDGETFTERGRLHPYIGDPPGRIVFSDAQRASAFALLRRLHDALGGMCHGDYGPWNLVWRGGLPVSVIDFDHAHLGDVSTDVAYALRFFVGYGFADAAPDELARSTTLALGAYGSTFDVPAILAAEYDRAEAACRRNGWHRQLARLPVEWAWLEAHGALLVEQA